MAFNDKKYLDLSGLQLYDENIKDYVDTHIGPASVAWDQEQESGTKIAEIRINGVSQDVYAPTPPNELADLADDSTHRLVTDTEKSTWNNKSDFDGAYDSLTGKPTLGTAAAKDVAASGDASTTQVVMGNDSRLTDSRPASDVSSWAKASTKPSYTASEVGAIATTAKGAANGVAELDSNGLVPASQLPSYVDDVLEFSSKSAFPSTGETGKIYVATDTNLTYRWSGTAYVEISPSLALGETSSTAYRGDRGKIAYDHSQVTSGNPHNVTASDVGLGNVGNFKAVSTVASQGLTDTEKSNARANIGAGTSDLTIGTTSTTAAAGNHTHGVVSTSANGFAPKVTDTSKFLKGDGTWATPTDTKNTAGSTDTSSKIFLVGATSQAANPQTYSQDTAYVGTDGCLYSGGTKVLTAHQDISGKVNKSGDTMTGRLTTAKPINQIITGSGTAASDKGSGVSPRYFPALWTFNTGQTVTNGDIITIKIPVAGHDYGVFISIDNGTTYKPVSLSGTTRLTTQYGNASYLTLVYNSSGGTNSVYAAAGADARSNVTGGCWLVCNFYDTGNTYDRNRYNAAIKAWGTKIVAGNIIVGKDGVYHHLKEGTAFDISYPILYLNGDCNANATTNNTYDILNFTITTTQSITLTAYKPVFIKGTLSGTTFTPDSTTPLTQTIPTSADEKYYMFLGNATSTTAVYLTERHEIYAYKNGAFGQIVNDALSVNGYTVAKSVPSNAVFTDNNNAVTQTATTTSADYEVLFSATADNTTRTEGARKNSNLKFNPSTGNLQATQLNGVAIGSSPKFTDTTYTAATAAPGKVASASAQGSSTNYARQDHTHGIDLATGDSNGQVKIAGTNVSVKGLGSAAYKNESGTWAINVSGSSASCTGNAATATKLATARSIALGGDFQGSANFDGSGNITISGYNYNVACNSGNKANYPWHRIATVNIGTGAHTDKDAVLCIQGTYDGGNFGIVKISTRTNDSGAACSCNARWMIRQGYAVDDLYTALWGTTGQDVYADVFLKRGTYARTVIYQMFGSRRFTLIASNEVNNTTASDKLTSVEVYKDIATAATEIHNKAYTFTVAAIDAADVKNANTVNGLTVQTAVPANAKFTDTTYSAMSSSELTTGTATTSRVVRADYLKTGINSLIDTKIGALDVTTSGAGASKTLTALSETDGKISATFGNISITKSQVSDFPTSMTPTSHTHGNITNGGALQTNDITIASGDKLVVTDSSDSAKVARTSISFDGSTATQCLTKKGTWATFGTSNLAIGTTASTAAAGNHTHGLSIAADSGTSSISLAANTKYKITAGGSTYIFTTPPDNNTNNAVTQTATTTSADYEVLFSVTADNTTRTEGARKNSNLKFNPSTGNLTVTKVNGESVFYSESVSAAVNATTCTISNANITTSSMIEPFSSNSKGTVITITKMTVTAGQVVLTFPALSDATSFKVRITNV